MIHGKSCLIISATSDIGEGILVKFIENGVKSVFIHGRNKSHLEKLSLECSKHNIYCKAYECDLCDKEQIKQLKNQISTELNDNLDIFVFCAGSCGDMDPISFINMESDFSKVMQLNFSSCVDIFEFVIPYMSKNSSAVFITSTNTFVPLECGSAYCSSKCALKEYMLSKALELGERGIRVNTVAPGLVATKLHNPYFENQEELDTFFQKSSEEHPLGRIASIECVANSVMFLCSNLSSDITGTEMVIDCGETLAISQIKPDLNEEEEEEEEN